MRQGQVLETQAGYSYGKQIASYAITLKFPVELPLMSFHDAVILSHRERSLIALPYPININTLSQKALELIPGIGKKGASEIIMQAIQTHGGSQGHLKMFQMISLSP